MNGLVSIDIDSPGSAKSQRNTTGWYPLMREFHTLPVEEALTWIRAWTDHTWPMSLQEAFAIRDSLGWIPSPQDPTLFTTKLSTNGKEDGFIFESNEFGVKGVRFNLSSIHPRDSDHEIAEISRTAYSNTSRHLEDYGALGGYQRVTIELTLGGHYPIEYRFL